MVDLKFLNEELVKLGNARVQAVASLHQIDGAIKLCRGLIEAAEKKEEKNV